MLEVQADRETNFEARWDGERYWLVVDGWANEVGSHGFRKLIEMRARAEGHEPPATTEDEWRRFERFILGLARPDEDAEPSPRPERIADECGGTPAYLRSESELLGWRMDAFLEQTPEEVDWLVPGVLTRGWTTKIAAREKVGKGTLVYYLLGCLERGEATVFGDAASEVATAVVLTEEPEESIREKLELYGCQRGRVVPGYLVRDKAWPEKVDSMVALAQIEGHAILFVDNVSRATGCEDEAGTELARSIEYLMDAARAAGLACIVDHHHKKAASADHDASRGGTAVAGATDINVEMFREGRGRGRRLSALGRLRACNWNMSIELSEDGRTYARVEKPDHPAPDVAAVEAGQAMLDRQKLKIAGELTVQEFKDQVGLSSTTAARSRLERLVQRGEATREKVGNAHVYRPVCLSAD